MKKTLVVLLSICMLCCALSGCNRIEYNARILTGGYSVDPEWMDLHTTNGAYQFDNMDHVQDGPESYTYLITDQEALKEIFDEFPNVPLTDNMVLVHCYTTVYVRDQVLKKVALEDGVLEIEFDVVNGKLGHADAAAPHTRMLVVIMDRISCDRVNVTYLGQ